MTEKRIQKLVEQNNFGFDNTQTLNMRFILTLIANELSGRGTWFGSGGNFFHAFFQLKDKSWVGFHSATGFITISKPNYSRINKLHDDFWSDQDDETFNVVGKTPKSVNRKEYNGYGVLELDLDEVKNAKFFERVAKDILNKNFSKC